MLKSIIQPISQMDIEDTKGSPEYVKWGLVYVNNSLVSILLWYMFCVHLDMCLYPCIVCACVQNRGDHQECSQSHSTLDLRQWVSLNLKLTSLDRLLANRALWLYLLLPSPKLIYRYMISNAVFNTHSGHPNSSPHVWSANILVTEPSSTQFIFKQFLPI